MYKDKVILGLTESITLIGEDGKEEKAVARIDTGATSSSIDLRLAKSLGLNPGEKKKVVKSASGVRERPFVKAKIKLDGSVISAEFNLIDRRHMTYPILIGQNVLKKGNFIIDPNKE